MGKNAPINGQLGIQDASSNCPCFCFSAFSPWTLKAGSQGKALFWGEEKRGRGREIRAWLRRGEGESFFFFAIPANCETLASGKAVCLTRLIDFYGSKPRWKSVISYDVLPFLLITIDSYMIDLYHYVHDVICIICMIATILSYRLGYEYYYIHLSDCNSCIHDKSNYQPRQAWFVPLG